MPTRADATVSESDAGPPPSNPGVRSRHGRRSEASREQQLAVTAVVVIGALVSLAFDAAPTGHGWIDAVERAALVVVCGLAGSRARRWSLVVGATVATIGSLGGVLLLSLGALALAVLLIARDLRDRVWGAATGVLVGAAALGLSVGAFTGASALVAAAAVLPILWSGYRSSRSPTRRRARFLALGVVVVGGIGAITALVLAVRALSPLAEGVELTDDAVSAARDGRTEQSSVAFTSAAESLGDVADELEAWWALPARVVPGVAQNVEAVRTVSRAGQQLTASAGTLTRQVDYDRLRRPDGGIDLEVLREFEQPVTDAAAILASARRQVQDISSPWVLPVLAEQVREFDRRVADVSDEATTAAVAVRDAPPLLGELGTRRYLVLLGTSSSRRGHSFWRRRCASWVATWGTGPSWKPPAAPSTWCASGDPSSCPARRATRCSPPRASTPSTFSTRCRPGTPRTGGRRSTSDSTPVSRPGSTPRRQDVPSTA